jgi:hypothetical protein
MKPHQRTALLRWMLLTTLTLLLGLVSTPQIHAADQRVLVAPLNGPFYTVRHGAFSFGNAPSGSTALISTVPHWSNSFSFGGISYAFNMVGTSPFTSNVTTMIPTVIQPLKFTFTGGVSISPPTTALVNSPIFKSTTFPTGTGQFIDVFQRANFAKPVATNTAYHLRLGTPAVKSLMSIAVPASAGFSAMTTTGRTIGLLDIAFLEGLLNNLIAAGQYSPGTLPIFLVGNVFEYQTNPNNCCIGGFHSATSEALNQVVTFIYTAYNQSGIFGGNVQDIAITSHEVAEWANDPLGTNIVPPWGLPQNPGSCFSDLLEVGDAIEAFATPTFSVTLNSVTYHPQDEAFFSWFAHQSPSIGIGGRYSYVSPAKLTAPPPSCT